MLLILLLMMGLAQSTGPQAPARTYASCAASVEPVACVTGLAAARSEEGEVELNDLIAAGAVAAVRRNAPTRQRRTAELAARIASGEGHEGLSSSEAQRVLALFSDVSFYDSGLPGDARASGLWTIAMREPVGDIGLRQMLVHAASSAGREDIVDRLVTEISVSGRWNNDERASFASVAARIAHDWRVADAFMASGGERAKNYSASEIRIEIDQARLHNNYDRDAAARVLAAILLDGELFPWAEEGPEALKAAGAVDELRALGDAMVLRGRATDRSPEQRTNDFGLASWAYEAAGDRTQSLNAAREGSALTALAVAERISGSSESASATPAQAAEMANGFGTWPVQRLYELGAIEEALALGFLASRDRYLAELEAGRAPDPTWLAEPRIDYQLKLIVPVLQQRRAASDAKALLLRLQAVPGDWASADPAELMMLAALAGDSAEVHAIFNDAAKHIDETESTWTALRLISARHAADAELSRDDRYDAQSP